MIVSQVLPNFSSTIPIVIDSSTVNEERIPKEGISEEEVSESNKGMNVLITPDSFKGTFVEFAQFRHQLAVLSEIGVKPAPEEISQYQKFLPNVDYEIYEEKNSLGEWDEIPDEPLTILFVHSDSRGVIHPREAKVVLERLREVVDEVEGNPFRQDQEDLLFVEQAKNLIKGFTQALDKNQVIEFQAIA